MPHRSSWVLLTLLIAAAVPTAHAHHAQAPFFDQERTVEVRGTVVRWIFRNPHPVLEVEAQNDKGEKVVWAVQFAPATVLAKRGWTEQTFKPGDAVVAMGHPSRAPGTYGLEHSGLERADGSPIVR
ncbi:MAG TPA: DUF6152 family protein [Gammaproteobacteria bacterium]|jgi:hypothetical protein